MKEKELKIISNLRKDAKTSLAVISNDIDMPISTVYDKVNKFNKDNIIKKYTALVDFSKLGYHYQSKIAIKVSKNHKEDLKNFLHQHKAVNSLHEINNGWSFFVETIHEDIKGYVDFIDRLEENFDIVDLHEYQIINELKKEEFL